MAIPFRREKLAAQIQKELSAIVRTEMNDPRVAFVTVTQVQVSPDFKYARVYLAVLGDKKKQKLAVMALKHGKGFMQKELGQRLRLREVPELSFHADQAIDKAFRMDKLFKQAAAGRKDEKSEEGKAKRDEESPGEDGKREEE